MPAKSKIDKLPSHPEHGKAVDEIIKRDRGKMSRIIVYEDGFREEKKFITRAKHTQEHDDHELKQHMGLHRKLLMRKALLPQAVDGAYYVPFIGDADIASAVYQGRRIFGADLDPARVAAAQSKIPEATVIVSDCDVWPFPGLGERFAVCDFDSYSFPYRSFNAFWDHGHKADRLVLFFTDGHRQSVVRSGWHHFPEGGKTHYDDLKTKRMVFRFYWPRYILPWFTKKIEADGWKVKKTMMYNRAQSMYWGAVIERV